jgi:hypothetical protein
LSAPFARRPISTDEIAWRNYRFRHESADVERTAGRPREFRAAGTFLEGTKPSEYYQVSIAAKKPVPPKFGDVAGMCERASRLDNIEQAIARISAKLDHLIDLTSVLASPALRQAIGTAVTTQAMRVRK